MTNAETMERTSGRSGKQQNGGREESGAQDGEGRLGTGSSMLLSAWRGIREISGGFLQGARRGSALRRLEPVMRPGTLLFVCTGNLYRSPYAAAFFAKALPESVRGAIAVRSAGFVGAERPCLPDALEVAAARGVDLSTHRSVPLTRDVIEGADLIVVMDPQHERMIGQRFPLRSTQRVLVLGDLDPEPALTRGIMDPWDAPPGTLERSYDRIERCVAALVEALGTKGEG